MSSLYRTRVKSRRAALWAALLIIAVGAAAFWGTFQIARSGALDFLIPTGDQAGMMGTPQPSLQMVGQESPASATPPPVTATPEAKAESPTAQPTATIRIPPSSTATETATLTPTPTETATPANPLAGTYIVEYEGCTSHGAGIGTVKGVVFDRQGGVIPGAEVRISLNGYPYDQPAVSNGAGWYEFYLEKDLKVRIVSLRIGGQEMPLLGQEQEFKSQGGCFEHVNLRQQ